MKPSPRARLFRAWPGSAWLGLGLQAGPCKSLTPIWLTVRTQLNLTDADKPQFTLDRPWHRIVVHNVPIVDVTTRIPVHEGLLQWNEGITDMEIMGRRELCSLDALARR